MKQKLLFFLAICLILFAASGCTAEPASSVFSEAVGSAENEVAPAPTKTVTPAESEVSSVSSAAPSHSGTTDGAFVLRSFYTIATIGIHESMESFDRRPYLAIDETTELPETLPIYEDEYPIDDGWPLYPFEKLSQEEAEAQMTEYLQTFCGLTGQPVPKIQTYVKDFAISNDEYWYDDVNEQIRQMQYKGYEMGVRGSAEQNPEFFEATATLDEAAMLESPFVQAAISYRGIENPEFKQTQMSEFDQEIGYRRIRIAESCEDLRTNLLYDYFDSVEIIRVTSGFRVSIRLLSSENPLEEAAVIPYETAKSFIEQEQSAPVVYCEAAYNNRLIYPGRYIPVYKFYLQWENGGIFTRLVPMTEYPIPQGEEMQKYMNETFGEYATESSCEKESDSLSSSAAEPAV